MDKQFSEIETSLIYRRSEELRKAKKILNGPQRPSFVTLVLALGTGTLIYVAGSHDSLVWIKGIAMGSAAALLSVVVEQWSVRRRLEAAIQLLLSHEEIAKIPFSRDGDDKTPNMVNRAPTTDY